MTTKTSRSKLSSATFRTALLTLSATLALSACGTQPESSGVEVDVPPTEVVDVGAGDVTVVFEAGLGNDLTTWNPVATEVGKHTRVFAYSRPGYGQSAPPTTPRDGAHIVEELRALLVSRGVRPPYVLVGHSFGGAYMELFAKTHPDEVVGVVLVDPRHRDFTTSCTTAKLDGCTIPASVLSSLPKVQQDEVNAFSLISGEIDAVGPFGPYPVRVLTATKHSAAPAWEMLWESMLKSLASEAVDGRQIVVPGGHSLQIQHPTDVVNAILEVLPAASR